jgi:hypothetical protein
MKVRRLTVASGGSGHISHRGAAGFLEVLSGDVSAVAVRAVVAGNCWTVGKIVADAVRADHRLEAVREVVIVTIIIVAVVIIAVVIIAVIVIAEVNRVIIVEFLDLDGNVGVALVLREAKKKKIKHHGLPHEAPTKRTQTPCVPSLWT